MKKLVTVFFVLGLLALAMPGANAQRAGGKTDCSGATTQACYKCFAKKCKVNGGGTYTCSLNDGKQKWIVYTCGTGPKAPTDRDPRDMPGERPLDGEGK